MSTHKLDAINESRLIFAVAYSWIYLKWQPHFLAVARVLLIPERAPLCLSMSTSLIPAHLILFASVPLLRDGKGELPSPFCLWHLSAAHISLKHICGLTNMQRADRVSYRNQDHLFI